MSHIALKYSNNTHTGKKGPLLWVKLVFIETSFSLFIGPHHHSYQKSTNNTSIQSFQLSCAPCCLFFVWSSPSKPPILVSSSPSVKLWISPELPFTSPMWSFAVETQLVSSFHRLLSPLWFLNGKYSWVPPSRNPLLYKLNIFLLQKTLILERTYRNPCSSRPLLQKGFILFYFLLNKRCYFFF